MNAWTPDRIRDAIANMEMYRGDTLGGALKWSDHWRECLRLAQVQGATLFDTDGMRPVRLAPAGIADPCEALAIQTLTRWPE